MLSRASPLPLIAGAWALSGVLHLLTFPWISFSSWEGILYTITTIALIARPSSAIRFVAFLTATAVLLFLHYQILANHLILEFWISTSILGALAFNASKIASDSFDLSRAYRIIGPLVRIQYLLLYLFAALAKLNTDFLNPNVSCAAHFSSKLIETFHLPIPNTPLTGQVAITLTLLAEFAIPLLLILNRTRKIGLIAALTFHFVMGLVPILGISSFSSLSFTLLLFFLPEQNFEEISKRLQRLIESPPFLSRIRKLTTPIIALVAIALTLIHRNSFHPSPLLTNSIWLAIYAPFTGLILASLIKSRSPSADPQPYLLPRPLPYLALAAPVAVIGLLPYFGLQTQGSFTMFSNLRLLGENPNHLFASTSWQLSTLQLVRIIGTNHPKLLSYPNSNLLITEHELRRKAADTPEEFYILCQYRDEIQLIGRFEGKLSDHPLLIPLPNNHQPFIRYRDVSTSKYCECAW